MALEYDIKFIAANGIRLRLAVSGLGPRLLFLFGSGAAGTIDNAKPLLDRFSDRFTVACPDQRGLGQSDIPPPPWSMADYAEDAFAVADHLGWDRFNLIGLSFGGMVGLEMAAQNPQRIERMVLWGTSPGGDAHSYPLHELADLPALEQHRRFAELMDTRLVGQWHTEPSQERLLVQAVLDNGGSPWRVADPSRNRGLTWQLEARRGHDVLHRLEQMTCPTLIGAGVYDGLAPVQNARVLHTGMPNSRLCVYEAGHFFYLGKKAFYDGFSFLADMEPPPAPARALSGSP